jgi:hypothetical protein
MFRWTLLVLVLSFDCNFRLLTRRVDGNGIEHEFHLLRPFIRALAAAAERRFGRENVKAELGFATHFFSSNDLEFHFDRTELESHFLG